MPAADCSHPWEHLRPSIPGVVCQKCESTFVWAKAGFLIWMNAHQRMDELADDIERLDNAMSLLGLEPCVKCGAYYKPGSDDGLTLAGAPTCLEHVTTRFEDDNDLADDGVRRSATIELARWLVQHSAAATRWLDAWARVTDGLREVYACLRRHDGHFDEQMLHIMIRHAETAGTREGE